MAEYIKWSSVWTVELLSIKEKECILGIGNTGGTCMEDGQAGAATPAGNQGRLQSLTLGSSTGGSWEDFLEAAQGTVRTARGPRLLLTIAH